MPRPRTCGRGYRRSWKSGNPSSRTAKAAKPIDSTPKNLSEVLENTVRVFPQKKAFLSKENGAYHACTWSQFAERVGRLAQGFAAQGLSKGDRIAILSENRLEWALIDMAALRLGAISVPIYTSLTSAEIRYLLEDSQARFVAVSSRQLLEKVIPIHKSLPSLKAVIGFDPSLTVSRNELGVDFFILKDLEKQAASSAPLADSPSDTIATLIYTSGTTGPPKGVMLTHGNFIHNLLAGKKALKMGETDVHLSFLPLSHVFERMAGYYLMMHLGATIAYAENMDSVPQNLLEVRPTFIIGVPRFYEKIQGRILDAVKAAKPARQKLFRWAQELGAKKRQKTLDPIDRLCLGIAGLLVYKKVRHRLGGRVRFCISGGAPLAKDLAEFFYDLGVMIVEGYGLTETSPVISANREQHFKFGSVGLPLEGIEVKIAQDGEILTKSPSVMKGYFGKPEETAAVLIDGWFHTGDLGQIDSEGFLSITGRKKELIVTSGGKKVSPRPIEEVLEKDSYILRAVLFGDGKKFITALIVPKKEALLRYASKQKIVFSSYPNLLKDENIYHFLDGRIQSLTADLASFEKIKYFVLLENDFTQEAGELTPTLKVKRATVLARHQERLLALYQNNRGL